MNEDQIQIARDAYTAFGTSLSWKNEAGSAPNAPMPKSFDDLPPRLRDAWQAAAAKMSESLRASSPDREQTTARENIPPPGRPPST
jgi:hypothetical protein